MEFPHLDDTSFPLLNNVNVYSYRNEFDYTRWVPSTRVKLTNVLWNSDYNDVVSFESDAARDAWFDSREDYYEVTLTTNHTLPPEGGIKLPIPFDVAARYNYLAVEIPVMTSEGNQIMYEDSDTGMRRWYFFVDEVSSRAPNTTMFMLSLDVWTQFQHDIEINYMFLERGHAPVAETDTDTYLSDPIRNNQYLLTPDVTPASADIIRSSRFVPFSSGTKYVCIVSTLAPSGFPDLGSVTHDSDEYTFESSLTFSDIDVRHGYQLDIDGIHIGNGEDYSTLGAIDNSEISSKASHGRIPGNVEVYAIRSDYVYQGGRFFQDVMYQVPHFMNTVLGCFVVDESMIEFDSSYSLTLAGYHIDVVYGASSDVDIPTLTKSQFGYPQRYQRFAKMYTYPYASLELTNNEGETVTVRIENTGDIVAHKVTNVAFPCLRMRMFFTGIDGTGSETYSWKFLNNQTTQLSISNSDWFKYCFDMDIPCFAVYMDESTAWYLDNFNTKIRDAGRNIESAYQQSMRLSNTQYENDKDLDNTNYVNAQNTNNTNYTNADADATTLVNNTANTTATNTANVNATIATNADKVNDSNTTSTLMRVAGDDKLTKVNSYADASTVYISGAQNEATAATARINSVGAVNSAGYTAIAGAAIGSIVPGAGTLAGAAAGMAIGGVGGLISAAIGMGTAESAANQVISTNQTVCDMNIYENDHSLQATLDYNFDITQLSNAGKTYATNADNTLLSGNNTRSNNNLTQNNANTAGTLRNNADRTRDTGITNAGNTKDVLDMNSMYMNHWMRSLNAQQQAEATRYGTQYELWASQLRGARQLGSYAGDPMQDFTGQRGIQVRVRTMNDSETRQVGDWFARYGYALEQVWDVNETGLCPMNHFCYWKCRDIWVDDRKSSNNNAQLMITAMFERGVTIWNDPDEIGKVSVYDN